MARKLLPSVEIFSTFADPEKPFHDQVKGDRFWVQTPLDYESYYDQSWNWNIYSEHAYQQYDTPTFGTMSSRYTSNAMICTGNTCAALSIKNYTSMYYIGSGATLEFWLEPDNVNTTEKQIIWSAFDYYYQRTPDSTGRPHFYIFLQNGKLTFELGWSVSTDTIKISVDVSNKTAPFHVSISGYYWGNAVAANAEDTYNTRVFIDGQFVQPEIVKATTAGISFYPCWSFIGAPPIFKTPYDDEITGYKGKIAQFVLIRRYDFRETNFTPRTSGHTASTVQAALPLGLDSSADVCVNLSSITDKNLNPKINHKMIFTMPNVYTTYSKFDGHSVEVNSQSDIMLLSDAFNFSSDTHNGINSTFSSWTIEFCAKYNSSLDPDLADTDSVYPITVYWGGYYGYKGRWSDDHNALFYWVVHPSTTTTAAYGSLYTFEGAKENTSRTTFYHIAITFDGLWLRTYCNGALLSSFNYGGQDSSNYFGFGYFDPQNVEFYRLGLGSSQGNNSNYYAFSHVILVTNACAYTKAFSISYPPRLIAYRYNNKTNYVIVRNNYSEQWYAKVESSKTSYQWKTVIKNQPYVIDLVPYDSRNNIEYHSNVVLRKNGQDYIFQNSTMPTVFFDPCHNYWVRTNTMEDYLFLKNVTGAGYYNYCYILDYNKNHNQKICEQDIGIYCYNPNLLDLNASWTIEIGVYFFDSAHINAETIFELYGALTLNSESLTLYNEQGGVDTSFTIASGQIQAGKWHVFNLIKNGNRMSLYLDKVLVTHDGVAFGSGNIVFPSDSTKIDFSRVLPDNSTNYLFKRNNYFHIGGSNYEMGIDMCRISNIARSASLNHTTYKYSSVTTNVTAQLIFNKFGGFTNADKYSTATYIEA